MGRPVNYSTLLTFMVSTLKQVKTTIQIEAAKCRIYKKAFKMILVP